MEILLVVFIYRTKNNSTSIFKLSSTALGAHPKINRFIEQFKSIFKLTKMPEPVA